MKSNFVDYINSTYLIYSFKPGREIRVFDARKRTFFACLSIVSTYEMVKFITNGILNDNLIRLYIGDFICTFSKHQALFNLSLSVSFIFFLRAIIYFFRNDNDEHLNKFQYLNFLQLGTEELTKRHQFTRTEANQFVNRTNAFIKFSKTNRPIYFLGVILGVIRVSIVAYSTIELKWFLFCTLPNLISFLILITFIFNIVISFYLIFALNCLFLVTKLKSISYQHFALLTRLIKERKLNIVVQTNLVHFNQIVQNFNLSQKDFNYSIASYNSGLFIVCFSFPYLLFFQTDDLISKFFCASLYLQSMIIAIYEIIGFNCYLDSGVWIQFVGFQIFRFSR